MNITFMLGNGFDLGLDMPTKYEDFYKEYCKITSNDNDNIVRFKKTLIQRHNNKADRIVDWSDFELAFGEHSADNDIKDKFEYLERFEHFVEAFNRYIEKVEMCTDFSDTEKIADTMDNAVQNYRKIRKADEDAIDVFYRKFNAERTYHFVTFNYTKTIDNWFTILKNKLRNTTYRKVGQIVHIHGYIDNAMILGVNDASQIKNPNFANDEDVIRELVKPTQNENSRTGYEKAMMSVINNSHIICLYGMSIGDTDKKWWDYISKWLSNDEKRILVILKYEELYNQRFPHSQDKAIRPLREKFLSFSTLSNDKKEQIKNRIFIGINNNVFSMKLFNAESFEKELLKQ